MTCPRCNGLTAREQVPDSRTPDVVCLICGWREVADGIAEAEARREAESRGLRHRGTRGIRL